MVRKLVGRPAIVPFDEGCVVSLSFKVSGGFKRQMIVQAEAVGLSLKEYLQLLVVRDAS